VDFEAAMEMEHCQRAGSSQVFETKNFRISTTPVAEWEIVKRTRQPPDDPSGTRRIPNIEELMSLDTAKEAKLIEAEVIAIVLYTGPMVSCDDDF
jgi:hypothetical protein